METLIEVETGRVIVARLEVADTFWRRLLGLQFRRQLASDAGVLLTPCRSVHTHWMRFSLDIIMLDEQGVIVASLQGIPPWKAVLGPPATRSILETPANSLAGTLPLGTRTMRVAPDHS